MNVFLCYMIHCVKVIKEKRDKLIEKIYAEKIHTQTMEYWLSRTGKETEI